MEFKEVMAERHSVRHFKEDEIPTETLEEIVRTAEHAPSWENNQPWNIYIATGETLRQIKVVWEEKYADKIKGTPDMPTGHRTNYSERSQKVMQDFMDEIGSVTEDPELNAFFKANEELFNAPALVYLTLSKGHTGWAVYDLGALGMALMLAAKDHGVDSIPAYEIVKFPDELRELLSVPDDQEIIMGIALGYPADDKLNNYISSRLPLKDILTIRK